MARNPNRRPSSNKPKTYTDKNRPSGFYNVAGKGKRYWNSYTKKWTKSPLGSTDAMLSKASGRDVTSTTQRIKGALSIKKATHSGTPRSNRNRTTNNRRSTPGETDKQVARDNKRYGNTVPKGSFGITKKNTPASNGDSTHDIGGSNQNRDTNTPAPTPQPPKNKPRFKGTVDEGRRIWAEKYSGDKYKGQAIHKEAKAYLLKIRKKDRPKMSGRTSGESSTIA